MFFNFSFVKGNLKTILEKTKRTEADLITSELFKIASELTDVKNCLICTDENLLKSEQYAVQTLKAR